MWVKVTTLSFQCRDKLNFTTIAENVPIMLALCLMLARPYYICSKLCWHNPPKPILDRQVWINYGIIIEIIASTKIEFPQIKKYGSLR